jgi:biopolymer transport protein ExbB/biopolymer transport protein TolQ
MDLTVSGMWHSMGLMARLIVITLFLMSAISLVITAERLLFFRKTKQDSIRFAMSMERMLAEGRLFEAAQQPAGKDGGYLGRTMESGLKAFTRTFGASREYVLETVGRALEKQTQRELQTMKRGQGVVATISSTAPFVGLLGTVMGIVTSFQSMAASGSGGLGAVSGGISEALVTTAIGLLVAIPAVFSFNWLQSWIDARGIDLAESSNDLLDMVGRAVGETEGAHSHAPAPQQARPQMQAQRGPSQTAQHAVPNHQQLQGVPAINAPGGGSVFPPSVAPYSQVPQPQPQQFSQVPQQPSQVPQQPQLHAMLPNGAYPMQVNGGARS